MPEPENEIQVGAEVEAEFEAQVGAEFEAQGEVRDGARDEAAPPAQAPSPAAPAGHGPGTEVSRVAVTDAAADLLRTLYAANGPLMFHQSGGCCDGSSPMCYVEGEFRTGASDVLLEALRVDGIPEPVTFWMSTAQFATWRHTHLTVDVVPGRGGGFSLESPEGMRFLIRSRMLTPEEIDVLDAEPVRTGAR